MLLGQVTLNKVMERLTLLGMGLMGDGRRGRLALLAVVGLAFVALVAWALTRHPTGSPDTVQIGAALPLTGDAAVYGQAIKNGMELAASQDQARAPKITIDYEDDRGLPGSAISAVRRLIDIDHAPAIIAGAMSSTAEPVIPVADRAKVVLLSPTATKPSLTQISSYFFRLWPSDDYDGKIMAEAAYKKLGIRRVAILYINVAYGVGITQVFTRDFRELGGIVVASEGYRQGATDFRTMLAKIAAQHPDAIYLPGYVAEIGNILRQARELDIRVRFIGVNSLYDPNLIKIAGDAAEGAVFTYPTFDVASGDPTVRNFVTAFRSKFGHDPDAFAAQGYDAYRVVRLALGRASAFTGPEIRDALHLIGHYSGPGGTFEFDAHGDVAKPLRLMTVRNGHFVEFME